MEVLMVGAEAKLYRSNYLGKEVLVKDRVAKSYRNKKLDEKIRRQRTKEECLLLHRAKELGVRTPIIYKIDKSGTSIVMELVRGKRVKDVLNEKNLEICKRIGEAIGRMHNADLIHGDLTTSNILLHNNNLVFIDFGLGYNSSKVENKAVDLLVFKKTFMATHFSLSKGWELILKGYLKENSHGKTVIKQIEAVEGRVRYH